MSDPEFLLVVTLTFCVAPIACCVAGQWLLARLAAEAEKKRRVWVVSCAERMTLAIVDVSTSRWPTVTECSCWCDNPSCGRTCLARLKATEDVHIANIPVT